MKILVTGGTGFLGKYVVSLLRKNYEVYVLSRSGKTELCGDLTDWDCGLNLGELPQFSAVIHLAGLYDLRASRDECIKANLIGTSNILKLTKSQNIPLILHASTVAASINSPLPTIFPQDLYLHNSFPDYYSESKAHSEKLLANWQNESITKVNLRFGVLVGSSDTGKIERIDGPYHCPEAFKRLQSVLKKWKGPLVLPGNRKQYIPLLPVDVAARAVHRILGIYLEKKEPGFFSYHLTPQYGLGLYDLYQQSLLHIGLADRKIMSLPLIPQIFSKIAAQFLLNFPPEELHYVLNFPQYDSSTTRELLGESWCPEFLEYAQAFWRGYEEFLSNR